MGNREALLAGAKRCLYEKGFAHTTARDIASASGVSLAAIGYHFGSKEALLNAALIQATQEWGDELDRAMAADAYPDATPLERFEATWTRVTELFGTHRQLWSASFELLAQLEHAPELRKALADVQPEVREGLAKLFPTNGPAAGEDEVWAVGSFANALLIGVMALWVMDPEQAPSGSDLARALRAIVAGMGSAEETGDQAPRAAENA